MEAGSRGIQVPVTQEAASRLRATAGISPGLPCTQPPMSGAGDHCHTMEGIKVAAQGPINHHVSLSIVATPHLVYVCICVFLLTFLLL